MGEDEDKPTRVLRSRTQASPSSSRSRSPHTKSMSASVREDKEASSTSTQDQLRKNSKSSTVSATDSAKNAANDDACSYCGKKGFLICCDYCPSSFHPICHLPALVEIPRGRFQCCECKRNEQFEANPIILKADLPDDRCSTEAIDKYKAALTYRQLESIPRREFELPEHLKQLQRQLIPTLLQNDEVGKRNRRKLDTNASCYICERSVSGADVNRCYFCPNIAHLDCGVRAECAPKIYAWRCPQHLENYLDVYMLTTNSISERMRLYERYVRRPIDNPQEVLIKAAKRFSAESIESAEKVALEVLLQLKDGPPQRRYAPKRRIAEPYFTDVEMRKLTTASAIQFKYFEEVGAIGAFFPAFRSKLPLEPIPYYGKPITFGTDEEVEVDLRAFGMECENFAPVQMKIQQRRSAHYLLAGFGGFSRVDTAFLMETPRSFPNLCGCIHREQHVPIRKENILGCVMFYFVFNPVMNETTSTAII